MDKNRRNLTRKINSVCVVSALLLSLLVPKIVYAEGELQDVEGSSKPIMAMTKNNGPVKSYDIQVAWGDMQFVYDYAVPKWDTENMEYIETGTEGWVETGFDGVNNKLEISNRSNAEITVDLSITIHDGVFNDVYSENKVQAHFYETNEQALAASKILTGFDKENVEGIVTQLIMDSAEPVTDENGKVLVEAGVRTKDAYFALSGTPNKNLNSSTEVGGISLIFTDTSDIRD